MILLYICLLFGPTLAQFNNQFGQPFSQNFPQSFGDGGLANPEQPNMGSLNEHKALSEFDDNLVAHGARFGDSIIEDTSQRDRIFQLPQFFPFYGARYNYTIISTNGYIGFGFFSEQTNSFQVGDDIKDWPATADPALMAPYLCRQRISGAGKLRSQIQFRVEKRLNAIGGRQYLEGDERQPCRDQKHAYCDQRSEKFLEAMERSLQEGVAGGGAFRADAALVVTWVNMRPDIGDEDSRASYQIVWMTDAQGHLAYTMTNYQRLNFDATDLNGNSRTGRCQAIFNGGNQTGTVQMDLSEATKQSPSSLAMRSGVPHVTHGRYFHRVDDVVRHASCGNKTGGTHPLLIYPNIVDMLGQTTVDVNGVCLDSTISYVLMIENRESAACRVLNPAIARCTLPKVLDWGTKTVFFQPQSGLANDEKAYVGFIYFVPPSLNPSRLDIGNVNQWYKNPISQTMQIKWYPRNFTNLVDRGDNAQFNYFDNSIYSVPLGLFVVGYKEAADEHKRKFVPHHRVIARLGSFSNRAEDEYRWRPQIERVDTTRIEHWYLTEYELDGEEMFSYRTGYLKLAPMLSSTSEFASPELTEGLVSAPIPLHWIWPLTQTKEVNHELDKLRKEHVEEHAIKKEYVNKIARAMCHRWYEEDGALTNFIRETETNSSCPCKEEQAALDLGRFMPHPRCSKLFRDVTCTETLGSSNCYISAQNVRGSTIRKEEDHYTENSYQTHFGQTCCYDSSGFLMQSSYQPVIKIDESTPYSPGFPTRSYEYGTPPNIGMFEVEFVPMFSSFHHDIMPYYLCCKYTDHRCQLFYWRRPSSACQAYEAPVMGWLSGAGSVATLDGKSYVFNEPGVFTLLHSHRTSSSPEVQIQVRTERYPDRSVNFGRVQYNKDRVVPSNVTVVTGVVLSTDNADKIHVLLRKDTYRQRYRTSIIVGNVIRYFDNMILQKFKGVTVYVNNVNKGQSEVYVVLDNAQIGVRIRESYAMDLDVTKQFFESPGVLDVTVSVPPQYYQDQSVHLHHVRPHIEGLLLPFPDATLQHPQPLQWGDVNSEGIRQALMRFKVGSLDQGFAMDYDVQDLFVAQTADEALFQSFPDHHLKKPVFTAAAKYSDSKNPFTPITETAWRAFIEYCRLSTYPSTESEKILRRRCPVVAALEQNCQGDVACLFDATMLQSQLLGEEAKFVMHSNMLRREQLTRHYNSCGAMNLEYPEYLIKGPSSAEKAYLEGDTLQFSCFQTHMVYGTNEFTCQKVPVRDKRHTDGEHDYMMVWTNGEQPFCRTREKDNFLTVLIWVSVVVGLLIFVICIFASCWAVKQKMKNANSQPKEPEEAEMVPLNKKPHPDFLPSASPGGYFKKQPHPSSLNDTASDRFQPLASEPVRRGSQSSLHHLAEASQSPRVGQGSSQYSQYNPPPPAPRYYSPRPGGAPGVPPGGPPGGQSGGPQRRSSPRNPSEIAV